MKSIHCTFIGIVLVTTLAAIAHDTPNEQQPPQPQGERRGPGPGGPHRPPPPVIVVLDFDRDGVIDAQEIANASQALLELDANGDGQLTQDELRPPHHRPPGHCPPPSPE